MQYDIANTRFAQIVTSIYDVGHYMLFDLSYWWWVLFAVACNILYFVSLNFFVYETRVEGHLGGGPMYLERYPKETTNPLFIVIFSCIDFIVDWMFYLLCVVFAIRLIILGFEWLCSPIIV